MYCVFKVSLSIFIVLIHVQLLFPLLFEIVHTHLLCVCAINE